MSKLISSFAKFCLRLGNKLMKKETAPIIIIIVKTTPAGTAGLKD